MISYYKLTIVCPWERFDNYKYFHHFDNMKQYLKEIYFNEDCIKEEVETWYNWRDDRIKSGFSTPKDAQSHIDFVINKLYKDKETFDNLTIEQLQSKKSIKFSGYYLSYETIPTEDKK